MILQNEEKTLSEYACRAGNSKGRKIYEKPCEFRTDFQRDRDKILHCNFFRRLKHKTQVFLDPVSDECRTRLTHTLEVAQIARTISRALRLNEDLTEAIALGHDLGHTPFGHDGENVLNELMSKDGSGGFEHAEQSGRVVDFLEKEGKGLNLTAEVLEGIRLHNTDNAETLEGNVVHFADRIAYINHDIEDSISAKVLKREELPANIMEILGDNKSNRITTLIRSIVENSSGKIRYGTDIHDAFDKLRQFMFKNVYCAEFMKTEKEKARYIVKNLFGYYTANTDKLPLFYQNIAKDCSPNRAAADYVASMSDNFAIRRFSDIFLPHKWNGEI
jgi:dGTPase